MTPLYFKLYEFYLHSTELDATNKKEVVSLLTCFDEQIQDSFNNEITLKMVTSNKQRWLPFNRCIFT